MQKADIHTSIWYSKRVAMSDATAERAERAEVEQEAEEDFHDEASSSEDDSDSDEPVSTMPLRQAFLCIEALTHAAGDSSFHIRVPGRGLKSRRVDIVVQAGNSKNKQIERIKSLKRRVETLVEAVPPAPPGAPLCGLCCVSAADTVYTKCGHMYACLSCSTQLTSCPVCRAERGKFVRVIVAAQSST